LEIISRLVNREVPHTGLFLKTFIIKSTSMKRLIYFSILVCFPLIAVQAQENKDVKKTTTIEKTTKKGTEIQTDVVRKTDVNKGKIQVEGSDKVNQSSKIIYDEYSDVNDEHQHMVNEANREEIEAYKARQKRELDAEIARQKADAAEKAAKWREEQNAAKQRELENRRRELTRRPDGSARLKKN